MRLRVAILLALSVLVLTAAAPPPDFGEFAYRQRLGNQLPLDTVFRDETGRSESLGDLLGGKPAVLALVYFHCPNSVRHRAHRPVRCARQVRHDGRPGLYADRLEHRSVGDRR